MSLLKVRRRLGVGRLAAGVVLTFVGSCLLAASASAAVVNLTLSTPTSAGGAVTPEFSPQVIKVHPGDTLNLSPSTNGTLAFSGGTLTFVDANCVQGSAPSGMGSIPLPGSNGGGGAAIPATAAPGTYFFFDPNHGTCSAGSFPTTANPTANMTPDEGELVIQSNAPTNSASLTSTVAVSPQFTSVTLNTNTANFGTCSGGSSSGNTMGFPNGSCTTPSFTVTNNGTVAEGIDVQSGGTATPQDGGTPWNLLASGTPGQDQFELADSTGALLGTTPAPDPHVSATSGVTPGNSYGDSLKLVGPTKSTDPSTSFSTSATWTAISLG